MGLAGLGIGTYGCMDLGDFKAAAEAAASCPRELPLLHALMSASLPEELTSCNLCAPRDT